MFSQRVERKAPWEPRSFTEDNAFHLCAEWVNGVGRLLTWRAVALAEAAKTMAGESPKAQDIGHNARLICQRSTARILALLFNILK
jgi:hypothetical protein